MQKIRKIVEPFLRKLRYQPTNQPIDQPTNQPTNQPSNYYQQHRFYRTWLTPVQKKKHSG